MNLLRVCELAAIRCLVPISTNERHIANALAAGRSSSNIQWKSAIAAKPGIAEAEDSGDYARRSTPNQRRKTLEIQLFHFIVTA